MSKRIWLSILLLVTVISSFSQGKSSIKKYRIGESTIEINEQFYKGNDSNIVFINLHDNERTSVNAAQQYLDSNGGRLVRIANYEKRVIDFTLRGKKVAFDPNRIYSLAGIRSTIKSLSNTTSEVAVKEVERFADSIISNYIDSNNLIIALHNNMDSTLSMITYWQQIGRKPNSGKLFINADMDPDDFILTTDTLIYSRIKSKNLNVVWENVDSIKDDGSLSIWAAIHKIPYINIEAQHGHLNEQLHMLQALDDIIKEYGKTNQEMEDEEEIDKKGNRAD